MRAATGGSRTRRSSSVANRAPSITMPTSAFGVRPSRRSRYGWPSQTVRPRAGPSVMSSVTWYGATSTRSGIARWAIATASWMAVTVEPRPLHVAVQREVRELRGDPAGARAGVAQRLGVRPVEQRLVGHVEAHHRDRHAGPEHDVGGLGVGVDVELGRDGGVPLPDRAAHQAQVRDPRRELRVEPEQQRDVGQRPDRRDRDGLRVLGEDPGHQVDGVLGRRRRPSRARASCRRSRSRRGPRSPARRSRAAPRRRPRRPGTSSRAVGVEQAQRVLRAVA